MALTILAITATELDLLSRQPICICENTTRDSTRDSWPKGAKDRSLTSPDAHGPDRDDMGLLYGRAM